MWVRTFLVVIGLTLAFARPAAAALIGSSTLPGTPWVGDVAVLDQYAYLVTDNNPVGPEFVIIDIAIPSRPIIVGRVELGTSVKQVAVENTRAYLATSSDSRELIVVDIANKRSPTIAGAFDAPVTGIVDGTAISVVGGIAYLGTTYNASGPEVFVIDTRTMTLLGSADAGARVHDLELHGALAFVATARSSREVLVLNVAAPASISQVGSLDLPGFGAARALDFHSGVLYVGTTDNSSNPDFFALGVSSEGALSVLGSRNLSRTNTGVVVYGDLAYVSHQGSLDFFSLFSTTALTLIDIRNLAAPIVRSSRRLQPATAVAVKDSIAYLATPGFGRHLQVDSGIDQEPRLKDINGDGFITVVCIGDSNTNPPTAFRPGWPEKADALVTNPVWVFLNRAVKATTAIPIEDSEHGLKTLTAALANDKPDAIVMGYGTNELDFNYSAEQAVEAQLDLRAIAQQAGVPMFASLVALRFDQPELNVAIGELNRRLRNVWSGPFLIDFATTMVHPDDYLANSLEFGPTGHDKRAKIAVHELNVSGGILPAAGMAAASAEPTMSVAAAADTAQPDAQMGLQWSWSTSPSPLRTSTPRTSTANLPPVWTAVPKQTLSAGQKLDLQLSASDPNGDFLTFEVVSLPSDMKFDRVNLKLTWSTGIGDVGTHVAKVKAIDRPGSETVLAVTIEVKTTVGTTPSVPTLADRNGDRRVVVTCIGDSNTAPNYGGVRSWCERYASLIGQGVVITNQAVAATTAVDVPDGQDGPAQLQLALQRDKADYVIAAFGTNDVFYNYTPSHIVTAYSTLRQTAQAAGAVLYVATTPHRFDSPALNTTIDDLNRRLTTTFAGRVIDFAGAVSYPADYQADALHMDDSGQARRAAVAYAVVR